MIMQWEPCITNYSWDHQAVFVSQWVEYIFNTLRPRQDGRHFADDIFKCIENVWISINISLKFIPKVPIHNIPAFVQIMAWCQPGDQPLSEPIMVRLLMHIYIYVTWPQWVQQCYIDDILLITFDFVKPTLQKSIHCIWFWVPTCPLLNWNFYVFNIM